MRSGIVTPAFILAVLSMSFPVTAFPATRKLLEMRGRSESHSTTGEAHTDTGGGAAGGSVNGASPCGDDCEGYHPKALIDLFSRMSMYLSSFCYRC
ncbi:hypothetical protein PILCRDRAFT_818122 [Piloderma croceum F 1598]|uniref:Uncharacterized protein n=1 Tax=Piloderma croceum (strain F 1598) TaxID=765440 RepID=A0A0C3FJC7_PILCF|nr:hypothetical protein PILCRDRAFT_818122 [Piloderma croceum F 1598]